jgi:hypothetical protein
MQLEERHRVQSVLAPRVGCRLGASVAAHPSAQPIVQFIASVSSSEVAKTENRKLPDVNQK